ncbi:Crotonobetainyl-CoA:carnitine CoA-transferase CaiB [Amycolatopsis rubida]|uniref:Crotonobetainyl-CoA:carnitine CoA-transferase CaiB n=2 Tax=Amycolatopsis rubida TaxID=112413 RepID=A0A1I5ZGN4_9PSEU|nr:Crotonobetainyl-CoA:carnitine CoA-transferase CaiB [Amycolatopsis rubida]
MEMLPLEGVRVLEIGQLVAIPGAGQQLVELGADVIKLEPPGGEAARRTDAAYAVAILRSYNRGKRSLRLDLKDPGDKAFARKLVATCDVVLHNWRPGALERLGFGHQQLAEIRRDIISVSVSGFGPHGPSATRPGLDIAAQAESGLMSMTGEADRHPQRVGTPVIDHATTYVVTQAVLAALLRRDRFGAGAEIRVPLLDVAIHLQTPNWTEQQVTGNMMSRCGNGQPSVAPAADVIDAADGPIVISGYQDHAWVRLCEAAGRPELADDPRFADNASRVANRTELLRTLSEALSSKSAAETVDALASAGVVAAVVRTYDQVMAAEDVIANGVFSPARAAAGEAYVVPRLPYHASPPLFRTPGPVPELGENDTEIRDCAAVREPTARDSVRRSCSRP